MARKDGTSFDYKSPAHATPKLKIFLDAMPIFGKLAGALSEPRPLPGWRLLHSIACEAPNVRTDDVRTDNAV
jgi:hypothetical protein